MPNLADLMISVDGKKLSKDEYKLMKVMQEWGLIISLMESVQLQT